MRVQESPRHTAVFIETHPHLKNLLNVWEVWMDDKDLSSLPDYYVMYDEPGDGVRHLRIQGALKETLHNWMDMQEIKNKIWGPETVAVEVYPAASQFKDGSNTYHLWTWPDIKVPNLLTLYEYAQ